MEKHQKFLERYEAKVHIDDVTKKYFVEKDNITGWVIQCKLSQGIEMIFFDYKIKEDQELNNFEAENLLEVFYCLSGIVEMEYGASKFKLKENHIGIYDLNNCPEKVIYKKGVFKGISLLLDIKSADQVIERYMAGKQGIIKEMQNILSVDHKLFSAFGNRNLRSVFLGIIENPFDYDKEYLMLKAMELVLISSRTVMQSMKSDTYNQEASKEYEMFRKAKDYIELHIADPVLVSDIAYDIGSSTRTVNRIFLKYTNQTAYQFLKETRLKRAKELLIGSDYSITEIAIEVGWSNSSKFSIAFKEKYGESPVQFRNTYKLIS
ncbi:helix-turn-helix domain-containing protein [Konateibacter massiliensis]|uniref:helix-turn-helix domain-containing protein n=1 Tax=Konateibacter massiliensis TaxID=2002841 RepID=UPI000C1488E2|nr:AraC family transcriptional regulator [Konateibacter massiliensis]